MNRLSGEKSPYLMQHATNPVDWYPWGDEAFERAKREDKPVFLSIGYAACHWCHVMEKESFADPETARLLNDAFVCIKVDREERPDLDQLYITAAQAMTGMAGWPLTILLTPDRHPFYAATYIPREARFGSPGLKDLIPRIVQAWQEKREEILSAGSAIADALNTSNPVQGKEPGVDLLHRTYDSLRATYDMQNGGFGNAPKFPSPHTILFLLRYWNRTGKRDALGMAASTLDAIAAGGIRDHIGGGFHRYSTDAGWLVPHFEKILYDQALLSIAYAELFQATENPRYREIAEDTLDYVLTLLASPEGGFWSSEDADSEGEEGKYYLWERSEIENVLGKDEGEFFSGLFGITAQGNFREPGSEILSGKNILHIPRRDGIPLGMMDSDPGKNERIALARQKLAKARNGRVPPALDDKILTDWNGLMIAALARVGRLQPEPRNNSYYQAAEKGVEFLLRNLRNTEGRLLHRFHQGTSGIPALASDYAYLIWGLVELYETGYEPKYLKDAVRLQEEFIRYFLDPDGGGFYSSPNDASDIIARQKELYDGAMPSTNSVAFRNLILLSHLTGNSKYENLAGRVSRIFTEMAEKAPAGFTFFGSGLDFALGPSWELVLCETPGGEGAGQLLRELNQAFLPSLVTLVKRPGKSGEELGTIAPYTKDMVPKGDQPVTAYLCSGNACSIQTSDINKILDILKNETLRGQSAERKNQYKK